jgi:signal transduction histidine kinase/HAMP domain-containing protein/CheY-like chemotaxis protein
VSSTIPASKLETRRSAPTASGALDLNTLLKVLTAVKKGDFSVRMPVGLGGIQGRIADTLNEIIELNQGMAEEVERVSLAVGKEGKTRERASLPNASKGWTAKIESVNTLIDDLVHPTNDAARVIGAVAKGDLSQVMALEIEGRPLKGEFLRTAKVVNSMVSQLGSFASEVTRVAREVGTEGKLGGQAVVPGVAGTWKDLTDSVNSMASNLTGQVRNIADVTTAVANGDLSKKITVDVKGEILKLKDTINTMVDQLRAFASEVTRVAREVGTEGKLGGQAEVPGVAGTWKDLTDSVNSMASNLTGQVRNIADVTTAVANGDLSKKITVDVKGEILKLKNTINTMVDQLRAFASEVTRVAREVGTEGKLGGQAAVPGVAGTWKDLTDSVNSMASNLTGQVRNIADVTTAVANGDLSKKITVDVKGEILKLKDTINTMVDQLRAFASEVTRVAREVGTEGKLGGQAAVPGVAGTWKDLTDSVNSMASNLTAQVRNIADVTTAVADGDLSKKITVDVKGEILELKDTINTMVDQLNAFASEVTRVAREVGMEGKLGGQAVVKGVAGVWEDLTDNVNSMASNLTTQVRGIAKVVTAVANGDLKRKLVLEAKGEIAELADTINGMIDTLAVFGDQVTTVAREVGIEGQLGGQARVPGAAGSWLDLTNNVNQLAGNLTTQVRAIAEVATAVTKGDLTRSISVEAAGEVASLKDNINEMIRNLKETTRRNTDQDWLKTNLAKFSRMLQGERDLLAVSKTLLFELAPLVSAQHGVFCVVAAESGDPVLKVLASYAWSRREEVSGTFRMGEGLLGQCALEGRRILLTNVTADYVRIGSGLGEAPAVNVVVLPVLFEGQVKAVIELASFSAFTDVHLAFFEQLTDSVGVVLNTITSTMRTEELLKQSQALTEQLQTRQEELTETNRRLEQQAKTLQQSEELLKSQQGELQGANEELEERALLLAEQKTEVERKNREIEQAKALIEEKAEQLALTSKYKSEFLANMSHELRTPLNSLLILSRLLSENADENLTPKQVEHAQTIHSSGSDLLELINDILDLAKIESGTMRIELSDEPFADLRDFAERTFRQVASAKGLEFAVDVEPALPKAIRTDRKLLQQVLRNLLSNAFKFTEEGKVSLRMQAPAAEPGGGGADLDSSGPAVAFVVGDTGIGIPAGKQEIIFEAFQQVDGTTSRKYGGTGLGLSISREITRLLGGRIRVESAPGAGSTFTLYLPLAYHPPAWRARGPEAPAAVPVPPRPAGAQAPPPPEEEAPRIDDDRESLAPDDPVVLIVGEDRVFAETLVGVARDQGLKAVVASSAGRVIALAREIQPLAALVDFDLPNRDGWIVLDRLKHDPATSHIPALVLTGAEADSQGARLGAIACLERSGSREAIGEALSRVRRLAERPARRVLIVDGDEERRAAIVDLIGGEETHVRSVAGGAEALRELAGEEYDCLLLGRDLPDMGGIDLIERLRDGNGREGPPIIVYESQGVADEEAVLAHLGQRHAVRWAPSRERLLYETVMALHLPEARLPKARRRTVEMVRRGESGLADRQVLIVDDDVRNIFALTAVLERQQMRVLHAENGKDGIGILRNRPGIDLVLMDVMMPEMDGYETIREIRRRDEFRDLPIITLTAKAMKGDREKCIEAGASDYVAKPVDPDHLLSMLRTWLHES